MYCNTLGVEASLDHFIITSALIYLFIWDGNSFEEFVFVKVNCHILKVLEGSA